LSDFIPGGEAVGTLLSLLWRLISYYPYLIIGAILFPWWIKNKFRKQVSA
jgi:glycosyltransferase 2 family protein